MGIKESEKRREIPLFHSRAVQIFLGISFLFWATSVVTNWLGWQSVLEPRIDTMYGYPDLRSDFMLYSQRFQSLHTAGFFAESKGWPFTYPAPCAVLYQLFFYLGHGTTLVFSAALVAIVVAVACLFTHPLVKRSPGLLKASIFVLLTVAFSFPFSFEWQRSNIEIFNWLLLCGAVTAYWHSYWKTAAVLLGLAISLKLFPFILLGLFVSEKKYREAVLAIVLAVGANVISEWWVGPTYAVAHKHIADGLAYFQNIYVLGKLHLELAVKFQEVVHSI